MSGLLDQKDLEDFARTLPGYEPGRETIQSFLNSKFAVIAGPTGAGKDTIRNKLTSEYHQYKTILSTTTRPPRSGEKDGVDYHFRSVEFIKKGLANKRFLQAELVHKQQVSALDVSEISRLRDDQIGLAILVVQAEVKLREINPSFKTVFVIPPSLAILQERMQSSRNMGFDELKRRLAAATAELEIALEQPGYYCVVNDDIEDATFECHEFICEGNKDNILDEKARQTAATILDELKSL